MRKSTITNLVKIAQELSQKNDVAAAFALYWIAYEGLWARGLVKALWLRGCNVKDAEKFVEQYSHKDQLIFLREVVGMHGRKSPFINLVRTNYSLRSRFIHRAVENRVLMKLMNTAFDGLFKNPELLFQGVRVAIPTSKTQTKYVKIGDPLKRLKRGERGPRPTVIKPLNIIDVRNLVGAVANVVGIRRGAISGNMMISFQAARSIG